MSVKYKLLTLLFILFTAISCAEDPDQNPDEGIEQTPDPNAISILPLGASRVEGERPSFESYRYELWKLMVNAGWNIDYIGTQEDDASYPAVNGFSFDNDHEGRGGWTSGELLQGVSGWLQQSGAPDIVLLSSPGGNDGLSGQSYDQAVENINAIIDIIQASNSNVTIIIEQMAPGSEEVMQEGDLSQFINQMNAEVLRIADQQSTASSRVLTVDMFTGFTESLLADDVHYNEAGAAFIAERYFAVLADLIDE